MRITGHSNAASGMNSLCSQGNAGDEKGNTPFTNCSKQNFLLRKHSSGKAAMQGTHAYSAGNCKNKISSTIDSGILMITKDETKKWHPNEISLSVQDSEQ